MVLSVFMGKTWENWSKPWVFPWVFRSCDETRSLCHGKPRMFLLFMGKQDIRWDGPYAGFLSHRATPSHPFLDGDVPWNKPSSDILGYPHFRKPPYIFLLIVKRHDCQRPKIIGSYWMTRPKTSEVEAAETSDRWFSATHMGLSLTIWVPQIIPLQ